MSDNFDFVKDVLSCCKRKDRHYKTLIIKDSSTNLYRIAKAEDVEKRFNVLHSSNPDIILVKVIDRNVKSEILNELGVMATGEDWLSIGDKEIETIINKYTKMEISTELVFRGDNGQVVTNSIIVAKKFEKDHKHVLCAIRKLMTAQNSAVHKMFDESSYINEQNKVQPMFLMNRDGFTLLAMGFTGLKAMDFKIEYINAFNKMEDKIKKQMLQLPDFTNPAEAARAWAQEYEQKTTLMIENKRLEEENIQLAVENQELKNDKNYLDLIMRSKALLTISQIAQDYGMSGKALNKKLADMGIQYSINGQWILYAKYKDCGYVSSRSIDITRADGRPDVVLHTEWTQAGRKFLYEELKKEGIIPMLERD